jgi:hypothetical protein
MPTFTLQEREPEWVTQAPVVITNRFPLSAPPDQVFARLADLGSWSDWIRGMRKVRMDGPDSGVGALRTVWVGITRVQERFVVWEPGERMTFVIINSNTPGLRAMVEDWALAPDPATPGKTLLTVTVGIEGAGLLRPFPKLVRSIMARPLSGAVGITTQFP